MTEDRARELLDDTHAFPCDYIIKAIGQTRSDFAERIVQAARRGLGRDADVRCSLRHTPNRRHVAITLELAVRSPDEVLAVYAQIKTVKGLMVLL